MAKLKRTDDALLVVGSRRHEPGQLAFEDLGCSAACEEEKDRLRADLKAAEKRVKELEFYLKRYTGQEVDTYLAELYETREHLKTFQAHIKNNPNLIEFFELAASHLYSERQKQGIKFISAQGCLQWIRATKPGILRMKDPVARYHEWMLPLYARWMIERNPQWAGVIDVRSSRFDGYRPWEEKYEWAE